MLVLQLYDRVGETYGPIFEQPNKAAAIRNCRKMFSDGRHDPADFVLVQLGRSSLDGGFVPFVDGSSWLVDFAEEVANGEE